MSCTSSFYAGLLQWRTERIDNRWGSYNALLLGEGLDGGIVKCGTCQPGWLPYVEVDGIGAATERARDLGATVLLGPVDPRQRRARVGIKAPDAVLILREEVDLLTTSTQA